MGWPQSTEQARSDVEDGGKERSVKSFCGALAAGAPGWLETEDSGFTASAFGR
jgi:hypothetical protein